MIPPDQPDDDMVSLPPAPPPPMSPIHFQETHFQESHFQETNIHETHSVPTSRPVMRKKPSFDSAMEILDDLLPPEIPDDDLPDDDLPNLPPAPPPPKAPPPDSPTRFVDQGSIMRNLASVSPVSTPRSSPLHILDDDIDLPSSPPPPKPSSQEHSRLPEEEEEASSEATPSAGTSVSIPKKPPPPKPRRSFTTTIEDLARLRGGPPPPPKQPPSTLMHCQLMERPIHGLPLSSQFPVDDFEENGSVGNGKTVPLMEPELIADTKKSDEMNLQSLPPDVTSVTPSVTSVGTSKLHPRDLDWENDVRNFRRLSRMESKTYSIPESSSSSSKDQELDFLNDMMMLEDTINPSVENEAMEKPQTDVEEEENNFKRQVEDEGRSSPNNFVHGKGGERSEHIYDSVEIKSNVDKKPVLDESGYEDIGRVGKHVSKPTHPPPALPVIDNHKRRKAPSPPVKSPTRTNSVESETDLPRAMSPPMSIPLGRVNSPSRTSNVESETARSSARAMSPPMSLPLNMSPRSPEKKAPNSPTKKHGFPWKKEGRKSKDGEPDSASKRKQRDSSPVTSPRNESESLTKGKHRDSSPSKKSGSWKSKLFGSKNKDKGDAKEKGKRSRSRSKSPAFSPTSPPQGRDSPSFSDSKDKYRLKGERVSSPPLKQPLFPVGSRLPPLEKRGSSLDDLHYTKDNAAEGDIYTAVTRQPRSTTKMSERRRSRRESSPPPPPVPPPADNIPEDDYDSELEYSDGGSWDTSGESDIEMDPKPVEEPVKHVEEPVKPVPKKENDFRTELSSMIQSRNSNSDSDNNKRVETAEELIYENVSVTQIRKPEPAVKPLSPRKPLQISDTSPPKIESLPLTKKKPPIPKKPDFLRTKSLPEGEKPKDNSQEEIVHGISYDVNKNIRQTEPDEQDKGISQNLFPENQTGFKPASSPPDVLPVDSFRRASGQGYDSGPPDFMPPPPPPKAIAHELENVLSTRNNFGNAYSDIGQNNKADREFVGIPDEAERSCDFRPLPPLPNDSSTSIPHDKITYAVPDQQSSLETNFQTVEEPIISPMQTNTDEAAFYDESYFEQDDEELASHEKSPPKSLDVSSFHSPSNSPFHSPSNSPSNSPRLGKSMSFSHKDDSRAEPAVKPSSRRPPPPMRRRSSSLPQLLPDGKMVQPLEDTTATLQDLINARNEGADVEEGVITVQLLKEGKAIGLMIIGGLDTPLGMLYIKSIQPGTPADKCGCLRVGDQLLQVNDECLVGVTHTYALDVLKQTPPLVKLTVARKKDREELEVDELGKRRVVDDSKPLFTSAVDSSSVPKTAAEVTLSPRSGREARTRPLSSFGTPLSDDDPSYSVLSSSFDSDDLDACTSPERASPTLNICQNDVPVTIIDGIPGEAGHEEEEEPKPSKSVRWAIGDRDSDIFTVELKKDGKGGLGIHISGGVDTHCEDITVKQVVSSSAAAKDGRIKKGDKIISVNGRSSTGMTHFDMLSLLKDVPRRVVLVVSRPRGPRKRSISLSSLNLLRDKSQEKAQPDSDAWPTKEDLNRKKNAIHTIDANPPSLEQIPLDFDRENSNSTYDRFKKRLFSGGNSKTLKEILHKAPNEPAIKEVVLEKGASGLGFSVGGGRDSLYGDTPIYIKYVFKDSVAARSELSIGDEVLEVNGQSMRGISNVEAIEIMRALPYGNVVIRIIRK